MKILQAWMSMMINCVVRLIFKLLHSRFKTVVKFSPASYEVEESERFAYYTWVNCKYNDG